MEDKRNKEEELIRLNNAIKYIQNEYLAWKEAGGGKKKKKKKWYFNFVHFLISYLSDLNILLINLF